MIMSRTPMRISFVGGGTDLAHFYREHGGAVLSMAINRYFYLSMHQSFQRAGYLLKYSKTETVEDVDAIEHRIIRQVFRDWKISGVDFSSAADIPAGTGLGSSSAFTSGLITLCNAYKGHYETQENVARQACEVEIDRLGALIGKQDQYGCAIGGLKLVEFLPDDSVVLTPIFLTGDKQRKLEDNLVLVYVGGSRAADTLLRRQAENVTRDRSLTRLLQEMADQARRLRHEIVEDTDALGEYLHEGWMKKRQLSEAISNGGIDDVYETARRAGATGGKLLGAGGAGFVLLYVPGGRIGAIQAALPDHHLHSIKMDRAGSIVIYDDGAHQSGGP